MADRTKDPIEGRARIMPQDQVGDGESEVEGHVMKGGRATPQDQSGRMRTRPQGTFGGAALSRQAGDDVRNEASRSGANLQGQAGDA